MWHYFHKTPDHLENSSNGDDGVKDLEVKDLEDKYSWPYFHKTPDHLENSSNGDDGVKDLEDRYAAAYFHKIPYSKDRSGRGHGVKDLEDKYSWPYFHKTPDHLENSSDEDDGVKDLEDRYAAAYFHKTLDSENHFDKVDQVKDPKDKYTAAYFHKTHDSEMKSLIKDHNHVESAEIGLFTLDELRALNAGEKLPIFFPIKNHSLYPLNFLPKEVADIIPFSSSQVHNILQFFSIPPNSPKAEAVRDTLEKCELEEAQGETKICATSLESLHGFLSNAFGPEVDFKSISTNHPTITTPIFQNYTVSEPPREIESSKIVACHPMPYLYAVYFCHFDATETKAFELRLVGDVTGDEVDALVVCHMDTSGWSSDHPALRMLGIKQGSSVCHVFSQGNLIWIDQPSAIPVSSV